MTCGERNREIIAMYESGVPKEEIQSRMGISSFSLSKILDAWSKDGEKVFESKKTVYQHAKKKAKTIKKLREAGHTWTEIVQITGVSRSSVYRLLLDERDIADWKAEALEYKQRGLSKREGIQIGDTVTFTNRGREVVAMVTGKQAYTIRCVETLANGTKITYSPQYQDVEVLGRHDAREIY